MCVQLSAAGCIIKLLTFGIRELSSGQLRVDDTQYIGNSILSYADMDKKKSSIIVI